MSIIASSYHAIVPDRSLSYTKYQRSSMPSQPAWFHRLDQILSELRSLEMEYLDRHAVEKLFSVRQRRARQLMAGLPALQVGNAVAVSRLALIARLETTASGQPFAWELTRRRRLAESLETLRQHAAARHVQLPVAPGVQHRTVRTLGPGIFIQPGELRIEFHRAEDLAAKLFELSQAMSNDWPTIERVLDGH